MHTDQARGTSLLTWARRGLKSRRSYNPGEARRSTFSIPEGERIYAIGDVHGRFDLLHGLLKAIQKDNAGRCAAKTTVVMVGDLIDRGSESAAVVHLISEWKEPWTAMIALKGNHEATLAGLLEGQSVRLSGWLKVGGVDTLRSYGISDETVRSAQTGDLVDAVRSAIPIAHQRWLRSLPSHWRCGDYLFVHAGVKPGVPLEQQVEGDLTGIRREFLESDVDHGYCVIHGHSAKQSVEHRSNRIGIDTGAWLTGKLTAVGLEGSDVWFVAETGALGSLTGQLGATPRAA